MSSRDNIQFQADEHPLVFTGTFASLPEYCLHLMHQRAYEEAVALSKGKTVLDLGCNNGYGTSEIVRVSSHAVGLDISATAIADARQRFGDAGIDFRVFDGKRIPFDDHSFDVIVSFQVIEHVTDPRPYLHEITRVLRPDGVAVFTTPNAAIRLDPGMRPWNQFHTREFLAEELEDLLRTVFLGVSVRGLFAADALYNVEFERCQAALRAARQKAVLRSRVRSGLRGLAKAVLPDAAITVLKARRRGMAQQGARLDPNLQARYSTADFFYRSTNLARALDLMAICRPGA